MTNHCADRDSQLCYVYLEDVAAPNDGFPANFRSARWFTRGWCLQELIAPTTVEFYAADWSELGTKLSLCSLIQNITAIPQSVLLYRALDQCSIAQKMSWASERHTTRIEDEAYCLLGLFGVNMPMLYGERERAFFRLQEEIIRQTPEDFSFLLWGRVPKNKTHYLPLTQLPVFAPRPACFYRDGFVAGPNGCSIKYADIAPWFAISAPSCPWAPPQMSNRGLRVSLPGIKQEMTVTKPEGGQATRYLVWSGFLYLGQLVCVPLVRDSHTGPERYFRSASKGWPRLHLLPPDTLDHMKPERIYLSTNSTAWLGGPASSVPLGPMAGYLFQAELSSLEETTIALGASDPTLRFHNRTASSPGDSASRTEVWRAIDAQTSEGFHRRLTLDEHNMLNLWVVISTLTGDRAEAMSHEIVQISMKLSLPPAHSTLTIHDTEDHESTPQRAHPRGSDRAEYTLQTGQVVSAGIKFVGEGSGGGIKFLTEHKGTNVVILRVTVLPRSLRPSHGPAQATPRPDAATRLESWLQYGQPPGPGS